MYTRSHICKTSGSVQDQTGWGFEQSGPVGGESVHGGEVETRLSFKALSAQTIL